jgi:hypothetical protein
MNRTVHILAWGVAGAVLTGALIGVAVAVAGKGIATPVRPASFTSNRPEQPVQEVSEPHEGRGHDRATGRSEGSQPGDDHGGDSTSGSNSSPGSESSSPGSGDSGGSESSGPGSGDSSGSDEGSGDSGGDHDGVGGDDDD